MREPLLLAGKTGNFAHLAVTTNAEKAYHRIHFFFLPPAMKLVKQFLTKLEDMFSFWMQPPTGYTVFHHPQQLT